MDSMSNLARLRSARRPVGETLVYRLGRQHALAGARPRPPGLASGAAPSERAAYRLGYRAGVRARTRKETIR